MFGSERPVYLNAKMHRLSFHGQRSSSRSWRINWITAAAVLLATATTSLNVFTNIMVIPEQHRKDRAALQTTIAKSEEVKTYLTGELKQAGREIDRLQVRLKKYAGRLAASKTENILLKNQNEVLGRGNQGLSYSLKEANRQNETGQTDALLDILKIAAAKVSCPGVKKAYTVSEIINDPKKRKNVGQGMLRGKCRVSYNWNR